MTIIPCAQEVVTPFYIVTYYNYFLDIQYLIHLIMTQRWNVRNLGYAQLSIGNRWECPWINHFFFYFTYFLLLTMKPSKSQHLFRIPKKVLLNPLKFLSYLYKKIWLTIPWFLENSKNHVQSELYRHKKNNNILLFPLYL